MIGIVRIKNASDDRSRRGDVIGKGALAGTRTRARSVEGNNRAKREADEAVIHIAGVDVISRGGPLRGDAGPALRTLAGACTRPWNIERDDEAKRIAYEAVIYATPVSERASDGPRRVDESGECALEGTSPRPWNIERGDEAKRIAHEAVIDVARIKVPARKRTCRVEATDCCGKGALEGTSPRARSIERGDGTVGSAHVAVS